MNPLIELKEYGQSIWFDNIRRSLVTSGELERMVAEYGVTGVTSNPTIFEKAISGGAEYDVDIKRFAEEGLKEEDILHSLVIDDIRLAASVLMSVYRETGGGDGYVSIEVSPELARDAEGTVTEALRLHGLVDMPNIMVKVPATVEGIKAIEELIYRGLNINATLLFSVDRYAETARAYVRALKRRAAENLPVQDIFSVASFFVSRVDALADGIMEERDGEAGLKPFMGKVAVANARLAFMKHRDIFEAEGFKGLEERSARPQKLLWASTGTKNPLYSDIKYVEELIGKDTINTMPLKTMLAFGDHGVVRETLATGLDEARAVIEGLASKGLDYAEMTKTLEDRGVKAFSDSYTDLLNCIKSKRAMMLRGNGAFVEFNLAGLEDRVLAAVKKLEDENFIKRLFEKDATLWKDNPEAQEQIRGALGWFALPDEMDASKKEIQDFAGEVRGAGFRYVVLLGMGGSSIAPLMLSRTFGTAAGYPELKVLDSTDPAAVEEIDGLMDSGNAAKTLFIVSSKSGSTVEPMTFYRYFHEKVKAVKGDAAGESFVAITDPGSALEEISKKDGFRRCFLNPPDVGGRFSALSFFGLVPAALSGIDISKLLYYASRTEIADEACVPLEKRPGIVLGAALAELFASGRHKVTFFLSEEITGFGLWIEQLLAESTGKEGKGLVPITGEPLADPSVYSDDRVFVHIGLGEDHGAVERLNELKEAGHPVIRFTLTDPYELGGEFLRWEIATAVAGHIMRLNPFDQPDVESAKILTRTRLERPDGSPPGVLFSADGLSMYMGDAAADKIRKVSGDLPPDVEDALKGFAGLVEKGDYIGLLAYYNPFDREIEGVLKYLQREIMRSKKVAVQLGFGPRYLHSTGQLHKGGPDSGVFIILTHGVEREIPVPGMDYGFSGLELSQAYGDMEALDAKGRRVVVCNVKDPTVAALKKVTDLVKEAFR